LCVLYALASLLILIIIALSIPLDIVFYINTSDFSNRSLHFSWLFGHICLKAGGFSKKADRKTEKQKQKKTGKQFRPEILLDIIRIKDLFKQVLNLRRNLFKSVHIKKLYLNITLGPEDPIQFGYLYAILAPVNILLERSRFDIMIIPVFEGQYVFDLFSKGTIRIYPVKILGAALLFIFSIPFIKAAWILMTKWK